VDEPTYVQLTAGGKTYESFTRISIEYKANAAARNFAFTVTDATDTLGETWSFMPGTEVTISANGQLILTGHIESMSPRFNKTSHDVEVSGRSKGGDTVDSSVEHKTGEFRKKSVLAIAKELDLQSVGFTSDLPDQIVPKFRLNPQETVFKALDRLARRYQMLLQGMPDGSIKITKGGTNGVCQALIEGVNILDASATFDDGQRHSHYKVRGQRTVGTGKKSLKITSTSRDKGVKRYRPKHIHQETDIDFDDAKKRGDNHMNTQKARSVSATIQTQSWFDSGGKVWGANALVFVASPMLKLNNMMLINSVHLSQAEHGSFSVLNLVMPEAYGGSGGGMSGPGKAGSQTEAPWNDGGDTSEE
jgi:prophage tail gpP-like protein